MEKDLEEIRKILELGSGTESAPHVGRQAACPLTGDAIRLMCRLDGKVKLDEIADRFPRILNRIAEVWRRPSAADQYFGDLLHWTPGTRPSYPIRVLAQINDIKAYHSTHVYPR
jgi:hypothetical protein